MMKEQVALTAFDITQNGEHTNSIDFSKSDSINVTIKYTVVVNIPFQQDALGHDLTQFYLTITSLSQNGNLESIKQFYFDLPKDKIRKSNAFNLNYNIKLNLKEIYPDITSKSNDNRSLLEKSSNIENIKSLHLNLSYIHLNQKDIKDNQINKLSELLSKNTVLTSIVPCIGNKNEQ